jgi:hypothetical protein
MDEAILATFTRAPSYFRSQCLTDVTCHERGCAASAPWPCQNGSNSIKWSSSAFSSGETLPAFSRSIKTASLC